MVAPEQPPSALESSNQQPRSQSNGMLAGKRVTIRQIALLLNSPTLRNIKTTPARRQRKSDAVDALLKLDAQISLDELKHVKRLGEGAFATVDLYKFSPGVDRSRSIAKLASGTNVALKTMKNKIPGRRDPRNPEVPVWVDVPADWRITFQAEALVLKALQHPNVVASYGCIAPSVRRELFQGGTDELMFLQEYCDGGSLLDSVRRPASCAQAPCSTACICLVPHRAVLVLFSS